jgi:hypothetical protein
VLRSVHVFFYFNKSFFILYLQMDVERLKRFWKTMRTRFLKLLKTKSGDGGKVLTHREKWVLQVMKFYTRHVVRKPGRATVIGRGPRPTLQPLEEEFHMDIMPDPQPNLLQPPTTTAAAATPIIRKPSQGTPQTDTQAVASAATLALAEAMNRGYAQVQQLVEASHNFRQAQAARAPHPNPRQEETERYMAYVTKYTRNIPQHLVDYLTSVIRQAVGNINAEM